MNQELRENLMYASCPWPHPLGESITPVTTTSIHRIETVRTQRHFLAPPSWTLMFCASGQLRYSCTPPNLVLSRVCDQITSICPLERSCKVSKGNTRALQTSPTPSTTVLVLFIDTWSSAPITILSVFFSPKHFAYCTPNNTICFVLLAPYARTFTHPPLHLTSMTAMPLLYIVHNIQ